MTRLATLLLSALVAGAAPALAKRKTKAPDWDLSTVRPLALAEWYQRHSQAIGNGDGPLVPGDEVGVLEPWSPPDPFDGLSASSARIALQRIQDGLEDGQRYTLKKSRGTKRWAGDVIIDAGAEVSEVSAKAILKTWAARGMIFEDQVRNPSTRKEENGLFVNMELMPGIVEI